MTKNIDPRILKQFKIGQLMGSGAYGHVWKVESKANRKAYALKKVFGAFRNSVDAQRTYRQVQILKQLKHENIIKLERVMGASNKQDLYLLFELMEADMLSVVGSNILSINHQRYLLFQLLKAISYLHDLKLIHRDLKPSNVLLDSNCLLKICDFGLVRSLNTVELDNCILSEEVATKWYRAPQLLLGSRNYCFPIDMWSFGCITAELLTGKTLFSGSSTLEQLQKILSYSGAINQQDLESLDSPVAQCLVSQIHPKKKSFSDYFSLVDPIFYPLLEATLQFNPNKRLSAAQCIRLQIFKQFHNGKKEEKGQQLQTSVSLSLDDNTRYKVRDYRSYIYDRLYKQQCPKQNKLSNVSKINRYKSLTNVNSPQNHVQKKLISPKDMKAKPSFSSKKSLFVSASIDYKKKVSPFKKRQMIYRQAPSPTVKSHSKGKNGNPYQAKAKQIALLLKDKQRAIINTNSTKYLPSRLKKVSKMMKYGKKYEK